MQMQIAVTTPTGRVGSQLTAMLVRAGVRPVVLVRDASRLDPGIRAEVDPVEADLHDPDAVTRATAGVDALYWVDPTPVGPEPMVEYDRATAAVRRAVTENGIARVVFQSSGGAEYREGFGEIDGLGRTEQALDETDAAVTHLRCGFFFSNLVLQLDAVRAGTIPVVLPTDQRFPWVAPRDIAEVAAGRLLSPNWSGRCVQSVAGPTDLSWSEAAPIISAAVGRPVRAEQVADDTMRNGLREAGLVDAQIEAIIQMSVGMREHPGAGTDRSVRSTTPTTLAGWAYAELRPLLSTTGNVR